MATLDDLAPDPGQVHALIPTRPTFSDVSAPTRGEVVGLARQAAADVLTELPAGLGAGPLLDLARYAVTLEAASLVELAYYPEQNAGDGSTSDVLHARYLAVLAKIRAQTGGIDPSTGLSAGGGRRGATARAGHPLLDAGDRMVDLILP